MRLHCVVSLDACKKTHARAGAGPGLVRYLLHRRKRASYLDLEFGRPSRIDSRSRGPNRIEERSSCFPWVEPSWPTLVMLHREKIKERDVDKKLQARLIDLLTPSTTLEELENIPKRQGSYYCPYLRFKQKPLDIEEWFVGENIHNGAHFPLCAFTNNSRARSEEASRARAQKKGDKGNKGGKHKGKGRTAGDKGKGIIKGDKAPPIWDGKGPSPRAAVAEISTSGKGQKPYSDSAAIAAVGERMTQEAIVWAWNNWQDNTQPISKWSRNWQQR